jgi:hypothetical protein
MRANRALLAQWGTTATRATGRPGPWPKGATPARVQALPRLGLPGAQGAKARLAPGPAGADGVPGGRGEQGVPGEGVPW